MRDDRHTGTGWGCENEGTLVAVTSEALDALPPLSPKAAFVAAYARMSELARHLPSRGFVAVAVDPIGRVEDAAVLGDRERLIVGRHTECDLRLDHSSVSLRHVALLLRYEAEGPVLHVWDLATGSPFRTEEGARERALVSTGPLYLAIDRYALWLVPIGGRPGAWPASAEAAFDALPRRTFVRGAEPEPKPAARPPVAAVPPGYRIPARPQDDGSARSLVTSVEPPVALDEDDPRAPFGVLALVTADARKRYMLSAERLARGILLGRYGRCDVLLATAENKVSRVHALLVRLGDATWVLDTASTNGTLRRGARVRACVLDDADQVALSDELELDWRRLG